MSSGALMDLVFLVTGCVTIFKIVNSMKMNSTAEEQHTTLEQTFQEVVVLTASYAPMEAVSLVPGCVMTLLIAGPLEKMNSTVVEQTLPEQQTIQEVAVLAASYALMEDVSLVLGCVMTLLIASPLEKTNSTVVEQTLPEPTLPEQQTSQEVAVLAASYALMEAVSVLPGCVMALMIAALVKTNSTVVEQIPQVSCASNSIMFFDGKRVPNSWVCDGIDDCTQELLYHYATIVNVSHGIGNMVETMTAMELKISNPVLNSVNGVINY